MDGKWQLRALTLEPTRKYINVSIEHAAHLRVQVEKERQEECRGSLCKRRSEGRTYT